MLHCKVNQISNDKAETDLATNPGIVLMLLILLLLCYVVIPIIHGMVF